MTAADRRRFVWVTPESVDRPRSGGALRSARLVAALAKAADEVAVVVVSDAPIDVEATKAALGVASVEWFGRDLRGVARRVHALRRRWPLSAAGAWSEAGARAVAAHVDGGAVVIADHLRMVPFHVAGRPWVLSLQNVDWLLARDNARGWRKLEAGYESWALRRTEREVRDDAMAGIVVVSEHDRSLMGGAAVVVPNGTDVPSSTTPVPAVGDVVFVGSMDYPPNLEAVRWWAEAVWPALGEVRPPLVAAGRGAGAALAAHPGVVNLGEVDDVGPVLERARVVAVPLRSGSGTRLKILEALAHGRPVVTTAKGAEGLDAEDGVHLLVADDPRGFAAAVERVLADDDLAASLAARGRAFAEDYAWHTIGARFVEVVTA
jgi:glycosyltransferase involved in cell wall biosynthesis